MSPSFFDKIKTLVQSFLKDHQAEIESSVNAQIQHLGDDLKAYIDQKINEVLTAQK